MKHNFFVAYNKRAEPEKARGIFTAADKEKGTGRKSRQPGAAKIENKALAARLNALYKAYENDPETRAEIAGRVSLFECNYTIAEMFQDKTGKRRLIQELNDYITEKEKETR